MVEKFNQFSRDLIIQMDKKIKITFYGGAGEVGGNKVLLEDFGYDVKIFLDFGVNVKKLTKYKKESGNPSTIDDLIDCDLLPLEERIPIDNLYSKHFLLKLTLVYQLIVFILDLAIYYHMMISSKSTSY